MAEPNGYIQGTNGVPIEMVDSKARQELPKKLTRPATAQVGDYLRIKSIGADGTMEVEAVPAPTGGNVDLSGYATEVWVQELLAAFPTFKIEVVQELPAAGEEKTIYLVPFSDDSGSYLEYLYVNGTWEVIGSGKDSGENAYVLPIGGEELGGVKNGGNVVINADGTMTAPEGGGSYTLPVANSTTLGGVKAQPKTAAMTQPVGVDANGNLYTLPPAQSTSEVGGVEFTNNVGNLFSAENLTKEVSVGNDVLSMGGTGIHSVFFRAKPSTSYVLTRSKMSNMGSFGVADARGICIKKPSSTDSPVALTKWSGGSGGLGGYIIVTTNEHYPVDGAYLIWAIPDGGLTGGEAVIYEGDSIDGYDAVNAYSPLNGTATTDELLIQSRNLPADIAKSLDHADTAIQPSDLESAPYAWSILRNFEALPPPKLDSWAIGEVQRMFNSARIAGADLDTQIRLGDYYAHCPTMEIIGDTAYVAAFQNTRSAVDDLEQTTIELWRVDLTNWTVMEQLNVASAGLTCGDDTLVIGGIDPNMLNINDETLRIVFTTRLTDGANRICYRDYDVASGTLGEVGVCKITNGTDTYDFNIAGIKAVCGAFGATNPVINMATQYATHNGEHYIGLGVDAVYRNIPILKTTDFITFAYWATPSVDGNNAHYECACAVVKDNGTANLYTSTRQTGDSKATLLNMVVNLADGSVKSSSSIPSGNARPFWYISHVTSSYDSVFLFHVNQHPQVRQTSTITDIRSGGTLADTVAMIYPCVREHNGELVVAYMRNTASLHMSRIPKLPLYSFRDVIPILEKMLDFFGDGTK